MTNSNMWEYGHDQTDWDDKRLVGYKVEASDGSVGKIDDATTETGANSFVVKTGLPVIGEKVMLPAGLIDRVDHDNKQVYVSATKDQVKDSPSYDESRRQDAAYRDELSGYYSAQGSPRSTNIHGSSQGGRNI